MGFITGKDVPFFVFRLIWLVVMAIVIFAVVGIDVAREVQISDLEARTLVKKAIYSEECFAYKDVRIRPLVIDVDKFNNERINKCIEMNKFSARFRLYFDNKTKEVINNGARFSVDKRLCEFGNYVCVDLNKTILVYNGSDIVAGRIHINATQSDA